MEFIFEFIFEVILEGFFDLTVKNPKVKTWAKTLICLLFTGAVAGLFGWLGVLTYQNRNLSSAVLCWIVSLTFGIGFLIAAIYRHKKGWK